MVVSLSSSSQWSVMLYDYTKSKILPSCFILFKMYIFTDMNAQYVKNVQYKMERWPKLRIQRSKDISLMKREDVVSTESGYTFIVHGKTDVYFVELDSAWPPTCNCEDNYWRPEVQCKHIMSVLIGLGVPEARLRNLDFKLSNEEIQRLFAHVQYLLNP